MGVATSRCKRPSTTTTTTTTNPVRAVASAPAARVPMKGLLEDTENTRNVFCRSLSEHGYTHISSTRWAEGDVSDVSINQSQVMHPSCLMRPQSTLLRYRSVCSSLLPHSIELHVP
jgi:hypothetical protein